jgi:hypothetical protein
MRALWPDATAAGERGAVMETTSIVSRVIGTERGEQPPHVVRVVLEREEGSLLLQLSDEAATQLLAHLVQILPKRGLRG